MSNQWRQLVIRHVPGLYQSPHIRAMVHQNSGALRRLEQEIKRPMSLALIPTQHLPAVRQAIKPRVRWLCLPHLHPDIKPVVISFAATMGLMLLMVTIIVLVSRP